MMKYSYILFPRLVFIHSNHACFWTPLCPQLCIYVFDLARIHIPTFVLSILTPITVCSPYTLFLSMTSVSEYNFAYHPLHKNLTAHFFNDYRFAHYYFAYSKYICIFTHTYEYTYMYSIRSSVHYDERESFPIHMYMSISSRTYTYIYTYR